MSRIERTGFLGPQNVISGGNDQAGLDILYQVRSVTDILSTIGAVNRLANEIIGCLSTILLLAYSYAELPIYSTV